VHKRAALALRLLPVSLVVGLFFLLPLGIMALYSFLEPGVYGGVEWQFYPDNFGRVLGFADGTYEDFDPVYLAIIVRSLKLALMTVVCCLLLCYPMAFWVARQPQRMRNFCLFLGNLEKHRFFIEVIKMLIKPTGIGWKIV